jgi:hypothetical protein
VEKRISIVFICSLVLTQLVSGVCYCQGQINPADSLSTKSNNNGDFVTTRGVFCRRHFSCKQSGGENQLSSTDLPETWDKAIQIEYQEGGSIYYGGFCFAINGDGEVKASANTVNRIDVNLRDGPSEFTLTEAELNNLLQRLGELNIERLRKHHGKSLWTDLNQTSLLIVYNGKSFLGHFAHKQTKQAVIELKEIFCELIMNSVLIRELDNEKFNYAFKKRLYMNYFDADITPLEFIGRPEEYAHAFMLEPLWKETEISSVSLEVRHRDDNYQIARIPFEDRLKDVIKRGILEEKVCGTAKISPDQAEMIGAMEDGRYLVAIYVNGCRVGHVKEFELRRADGDDNTTKGDLAENLRDLKNESADVTELDMLWKERPVRYVRSRKAIGMVNGMLCLSSSSQPVSNGQIRLIGKDGATLVARTDWYGNFLFRDVAEGEYRLTCRLQYGSREFLRVQNIDVKGGEIKGMGKILLSGER